MNRIGAAGPNPRQERSRRTVRRLLREADVLLPESGVVGFSMIALAERAGVNRATAYSHFPSKYDVFNSLAQRYLDDFIELVRHHIAPGRSDDWTEVLGELVAYVADLYESEPTARILFLGGALTPEIASAHHLENNTRVAMLMRDVVEATGQPELGSDPDPYLIVVETVIAVLATSQRCAGRIEPSYTSEARRLAIGYLRSHLDPQ